MLAVEYFYALKINILGLQTCSFHQAHRAAHDAGGVRYQHKPSCSPRQLVTGTETMTAHGHGRLGGSGPGTGAGMCSCAI